MSEKIQEEIYINILMEKLSCFLELKNNKQHP